jgi:hypothetical protein
LPKSRRGSLARIRDDDIEPSPGFDRAGYQRVRVAFIANVAREMPRLPSCVSHLPNSLPESALLSAAHQHARPPSGKLEGDSPPDSLSAAGDDRNLPPEKRLGHLAASSTLTERSMPTIN